MKHLRKPHFALFLSFLILFMSCSSPSLESRINETLTVEEYTNIHVELASELIEIFQNENNINYIKLESYKQVDTFEELKLILKESNVKDYERIFEIVEKIDRNNNLFLTTNTEYSSSKVNDIIKMKLKQKYNAFLHKDPTCASQREAAGDSCAISFSIAMSATVVSTFFTLGIGTVIGSTAAVIGVAACIGRANLAYDCCRGARTTGC